MSIFEGFLCASISRCISLPFTIVFTLYFVYDFHNKYRNKLTVTLDFSIAYGSLSEVRRNGLFVQRWSEPVSSSWCWRCCSKVSKSFVSTLIRSISAAYMMSTWRAPSTACRPKIQFLKSSMFNVVHFAFHRRGIASRAGYSDKIRAR